MKNNHYVEAFSRVTVDGSVTDSLMDRFRRSGGAAFHEDHEDHGDVRGGGRAESGRRGGRNGSARRGGLRLAPVFVLAAVLAFGTIAYASGAFGGGQFVKSIADPQGALSATASEEQDEVLYGASTEVAETVTHGNIAVTLDEVTADEFAIYTKLTIRSIDGKPLYTGDPDSICVAGDFRFHDGGELRPSTSFAPYDWERLDDGGDAARIEIAQRRDFYEGLRSFEKTVVTFSGLETLTDTGDKAAGPRREMVSDGAFEFAFPIDPIAARSFTARVDGVTVDVKLTPLSISYRYKGDKDLMLEPVDGNGVACSLGSGGLGGPDADGYRTGTFSLASESDPFRGVMIDVDSIVGVWDSQAGGEVYVLSGR
jgi:hypothetical protein